MFSYILVMLSWMLQALNAPEYDENGEEITEPASMEGEMKEGGARFGKWILVKHRFVYTLKSTFNATTDSAFIN